MVSGDRAGEAQSRGPVLQCLQPSELWASKHEAGRHSGKAFHADWVWGAYLHNFSADRLAGRRFGWREQSAHGCVSSTIGVLSSHARPPKAETHTGSDQFPTNGLCPSLPCKPTSGRHSLRSVLGEVRVRAAKLLEVRTD